MSGSTSNLSIDERKEDDAAAVAQAATATAHREQEALLATMAAARAALAWEKEKTIARHLKQQLASCSTISTWMTSCSHTGSTTTHVVTPEAVGLSRTQLPLATRRTTPYRQ
jgi:hypothetical protein